MFVHFGERVRRERLGFVADFCPICRRVQAFRAVRVSMVPHVSYVPIDAGVELHCEVTCQGCGTIHAVPEEAYEAFLPNSSTELLTLAAETHPDLANREAEALELERMRLENRLDGAGRKRLIVRAFESLEYMAGLRRSPVGPAIFLTISAGLAGLAALGTWADPSAGLILQVGFSAVFCLCAAGAVGAALSSKRRWARKNANPRLCMALSDLAPSREELRSVRVELTDAGSKIVQFVDFDELAEVLEQS